VRKIITKRLPSLYFDVPALRPGTVGAYALAIVAVGVATALRVALDPFLVGAQFGTRLPSEHNASLGFTLQRQEHETKNMSQ
jgi:hypothetical protein